MRTIRNSITRHKEVTTRQQEDADEDGKEGKRKILSARDLREIATRSAAKIKWPFLGRTRKCDGGGLECALATNQEVPTSQSNLVTIFRGINVTWPILRHLVD